MTDQAEAQSAVQTVVTLINKLGLPIVLVGVLLFWAYQDIQHVKAERLEDRNYIRTKLSEKLDRTNEILLRTTEVIEKNTEVMERVLDRTHD